MYRDW